MSTTVAIVFMFYVIFVFLARCCATEVGEVTKHSKVLYAVNPACENSRLDVVHKAVREAARRRDFGTSEEESRNSLEAESDVTSDDNLVTTNMITLKSSPTFSFLRNEGSNNNDRESSPCTVLDTWMKLVRAGSISTTCVLISNDKILEALKADATCIVASELDQLMSSDPAPVSVSRDDATTSDTSALDSQQVGLAVPNDKSFKQQWELKDDSEFGVQAQTAWSLISDSGLLNSNPGVAIGMVDSSVLQSHDDLSHQWYKNPGEICDNEIDDDKNGLVDDCIGWNFNDNTNNLLLDFPNYVTESRHGTIVAGNIGAETNNATGISSACHNCKILPAAVVLTISQIVVATNYLFSRGIHIVNYSFAGPFSQILAYTMKTLDSVLFVVAAGNYGCDVDMQDTDSHRSISDGPVHFSGGGGIEEKRVRANNVVTSAECRGFAFPGNLSVTLRNVVNVGAVTRTGNAASFSNFGRTAVQVFAPGEAVTVTSNNGVVPTIEVTSGTSFAAPVVSSIAGLVSQKYPKLSACQIRAVLESSCVPNKRLEGKAVCNGHISAVLALQNAAEESASPTYDGCRTVTTTSTTSVTLGPTTTPTASTTTSSQRSTTAATLGATVTTTATVTITARVDSTTTVPSNEDPDKRHVAVFGLIVKAIGTLAVALKSLVPLVVEEA
eukprot:GHVQ01004813.1.p1 GENE.GHVQ01004813.1~~GHVQ01004813.1.p1  ORF type:complete len:670 (-),score=78.90 GHVQ01004813.1:1366-3375(-)